MGSRNSNSVNQKKRRGRKRKKALIIFAVIAAVAGMLFGVTYLSLIHISEPTRPY